MTVTVIQRLLPPGRGEHGSLPMVPLGEGANRPTLSTDISRADKVGLSTRTGVCDSGGCV